MGVLYAFETLNMIEGSDLQGLDDISIPFHRAYAHQAALMAEGLQRTSHMS